MGLRKKRCYGCGKTLSVSLLGRFKDSYCDECSNSLNNEEDYKVIMEDIQGWLSNLVPVGTEYVFRMRWTKLPFDRKPIRVKGGIVAPRYYSCRSQIRRDKLPVHMVYACLRLWIAQTDGICYRKKVAKLKFIKIQNVVYTDTILFWYMLAYLYDREEKEQAQRLVDWLEESDKVDDLRKLCEAFPLPEKRGETGMIEWMDCHPLKDSVKL